MNTIISKYIRIYKDGSDWCVGIGADLVEGIYGFGSTPEEALIEFIKVWRGLK